MEHYTPVSYTHLVRLAALYAERGRGVVAADLAGAEGLYATDTFADEMCIRDRFSH